MVSYIGFGHGGRRASSRLAWNTEKGWLWRRKLAAFAGRNGAKDTDDLVKLFGPRWAYHLQAVILAERLDECYPSRACAERGWGLTMNHVAAVAHAKNAHEAGRKPSRTVTLDKGKVWTKKQR